MYKSHSVSDPSILTDQKQLHLKNLTAPLDAYWEEALIGFSDHYELEIGEERAGFYCLNDENQLVSFFLSARFEHYGEEAFDYVLKTHGIKEALAGTNDPYFLNLCLNDSSSHSVHTLLFEDAANRLHEFAGFEQYTFEKAGEKDFENVVKHYVGASGEVDTESVEAGFENLKWTQ